MDNISSAYESYIVHDNEMEDETQNLLTENFFGNIVLKQISSARNCSFTPPPNRTVTEISNFLHFPSL